MKLTTRIPISGTTYAIMMLGAAAICSYTAVIQLLLSGFSYHVLVQIFLALNILYLLYRRNSSGMQGFAIELFFIMMAAIVVLALSALAAGTWLYLQQNGLAMRSEYVGLVILLGLYCAVIGWQVFLAVLLAVKSTRKSISFPD